MPANRAQAPTPPNGRTPSSGTVPQKAQVSESGRLHLQPERSPFGDPRLRQRPGERPASSARRVPGEDGVGAFPLPFRQLRLPEGVERGTDQPVLADLFQFFRFPLSSSWYFMIPRHGRRSARCGPSSADGWSGVRKLQGRPAGSAAARRGRRGGRPKPD